MKYSFHFRVTIVVATVLVLSPRSSAQVVLQPWVQVYGTVGGQKLGAEVNRILPTANLPYKASIYSFGNTGVYMLRTQNDTAAQGIFFGNNMLTGDLNNDGWKDVVIHQGDPTYTRVDTVLVYWGTSTGIDTSNPLRILGENPGDAFQPSCIGDVNNDGLIDLVLAASDYPHPYAYGKVCFFFGPIHTEMPSVVLRGDTIRYSLGMACAIGDLNADGKNDFIVLGRRQFPSGNSNYVRIYWGVVDSLVLTNPTELQGPVIPSPGLACFDANGDGKADLLWKNKDSSEIRPDIWVHFGGANFSSTPNITLQNPIAPNFGNVIANAGDMNGDGFLDVAVGAYSVNQTDGLVFVFGGGPRIDPNFDAAVGMDFDSEFGWSVSGIGDINGDGFADIIVGAPNYAFGEDQGYWGIFKGDSTIRVTGVIEENELPGAIRLHQAYPNPFNPNTTIKYELNKEANILLDVFNVIGEKVATLVDGRKPIGSYEVIFNATGLASGTYLYRLNATTWDGRTYSDTKKLLLVR
jgi:hypothetical protein